MKKLIAALLCAGVFALSGCNGMDDDNYDDPIDTNQTTNYDNGTNGGNGATDGMNP